MVFVVEVNVVVPSVTLQDVPVGSPLAVKVMLNEPDALAAKVAEIV
jgi:hypothetical protein